MTRRRLYGFVLAAGCWASAARGGDPDWASIAASVNEAALRAHVEKLAACGSRVPGYPGHDSAVRCVWEAFGQLGLSDIREETFPVTVPVDQGSELTLAGGGPMYRLHALWPNLVRTAQLPSAGVEGLAVYGGSGRLGELNGRDVRDQIVFMEFNCGAGWLNAAMLGARAIVFIEPDRTVRREAEAKLATVPLNVPRFWMTRSDYEAFSRSGLGKPVRLTCRMPWVVAQARNFLVRLPGAESGPNAKRVCIEAYYDSMSIVPGVAPGAEAACGIAAMLELARVLKAHPPPCEVLLLATSAHHLLNAGVTDFVQRHGRQRSPFAEKMADPIRLDLLLALDLTSRGATVGMTFEDGTHVQKAQLLFGREFLRHANRFDAYAATLAGALGRPANDLFLNLILPPGGGSWRAYIPEQMSFDSAVVLSANTPAVTLVTVRDPRLALDTPLDRPAGVDFANLTAQTRFLAGALLMALNDPQVLAPPKMDEDRMRLFRGRLVTFDPRKSFMPDDPVKGAIGRVVRSGVNKGYGSGTIVGVRSEMLGLTDEAGRFEILTSMTGPAGVEGYALDPDTGDIVKALDLGLEGVSQYPVDFEFDSYTKERNAVLFECRSTDLYDIVDPRYLLPMSKLSLYDPGNAEPFAYGYCLNLRSPIERLSEASPYAAVFAKPGVPLKIGVASDILGQRMLLLNSPSERNQKDAEGLGYPIGANRLIENAPYQVLRDMHDLNAYRIGLVKRYGIENRRLERLHAGAGEALKQADEALKEKGWDRFVKYARRGLGMESRAYPDVRATADDVVKGIVFYMALLIPFAFFCERLFFAFPDLKRRLPAISGIFILTYIVLRAVHPAFRIVQTSEVILLGLIILVLCAIVVSISATRFEAQMRTMKQQRGKVHYTDVSRAGATATAFALGVSNMRRRKVRALLTCTAIVLLIFTVLSFTSVKTFLRPRRLPRPNAPAYQGALIRDRTWVPLKFLALDHLSGEFEGEGTLVRRSWLVPRLVSETYTQLALLMRQVGPDGLGTNGINAFGLVGFDAAEAGVSGVQKTLRAGRWFEEGERGVCIVPDSIAEALGIRDGDVGAARVAMQGETLTVIGIVDSGRFNEFRDLDNERLTPVDFAMLSREALGRATRAALDVSAVEGRSQLETFVHLDARNVVLAPYETVLDLGGALQSVAVTFSKGSVSEYIERLLDRLAVTVFVGEGEKVMVYSSLASSSIGGMGNILVPVLIAALMVLNTMSGSVHERMKEIGTYSSVGLAPSHIGALFLAEACVYAILGGIAGYVIGQVVTKTLSACGALYGLTLNYSSLASVTATLIVMATVVLSTLYPARMASRLAVPDVTRKWVLPPPRGDEWDFEFPFTVSGREVTGLYVFFRYYFASFEEQSVGRFYTSGTTLRPSAEGGEKGYELRMRTWLAPYDLGVSQDVLMRAVPTGDFGVYSIHLRIGRLSGQAATWTRINRGFLNEIRKQFLLWRTLAPAAKAEYGEEAKEIFG